MSQSIRKGVYSHISSGLKYKVVGVGRTVKDPLRKVVIYEQLYGSKIRDDPHRETHLPAGSLWVRDIEEFALKFTRIESE